jgi:hypothetical protein
MDDMLADLMTKGLAWERHARLLGMLEMGTCEVMKTTTPTSSAGSTSRSVEVSWA